jgi:hypothetical protein
MVNEAATVLAELLHGDPTLCAIAYDIGATPAFIALVLRHGLPSHPTALVAAANAIPQLLFTESARERIDT